MAGGNFTTFSTGKITGGNIILGAKEMEMLLKKLPEEPYTGRALRSILRVSARPMVNAMKSLAPVSKKKMFMTAHRDYSRKFGLTMRLKYHRPGELRRSIGIVTGKTTSKSPVLWVGPRYGKKAVGDNDGWYFHFLEYGTSKMPAKPFMRPAFDQTQGLVKKSLEDDFEKLLDNYIAKHGPKDF